jgi:hypothetical protein
MANCDVHIDLRAKIDPLGLEMGKDFAVVYDSTMARFWFLKPGVKERIVEVLNKSRKAASCRMTNCATIARFSTTTHSAS